MGNKGGIEDRLSSRSSPGAFKRTMVRPDQFAHFSAGRRFQNRHWVSHRPSVKIQGEVLLARRVKSHIRFADNHQDIPRLHVAPDVSRQESRLGLLPKLILIDLRHSQHRSEHRKVKVSRGLISDVEVTLTATGHPGKSKSSSRPSLAVAQATAAPTPAPAAAFGFLTLDTKPWSQVEIDGTVAGPTPLINKKLAVGSHQVVLVNDGAGIRSTKSVTITANDTTKLLLKLP